MQPQQPPTPQPQNKPQQIRIELPNNLTTTYANAAMVSQTHSEIIIDFLQVMPNDPRGRVVSRIAMTPANAKLFMQALGQNLKIFEDKHGEISLPPKPPTLADQLFMSATPKSPEDDGGGGGSGDGDGNGGVGGGSEGEGGQS